MSITAPTKRHEPICGMDTWLPVPTRILDVREENATTYTYRMEIVDESIRRQYGFAPGQFNMIYVPAVGEAALSLSSDPDDPSVLEHTIRLVGSVTQGIDRIARKDRDRLIGIRGPFGRGWPVEQIDGHDVVLVGGGIGLAPLRPMVHWLINHRERVKRAVLLFGCRSPEDQLYEDELKQWEEHMDVLVTVDKPTGGWTGPVALVTELLQRIKVDAQRTIVMVCGPRVLNQAAAWDFLQLQVPPTQVYVSLERNMNCGFGRCGHCQYGEFFVCTDGPVFCFDDISHIFGVKDI